MELLIIIDALSRGSARRITAVLPYFGYARQDRKSGPRTPISAKLVANLITVAGASRVLTFELHTGQIQGFFDIPTDNLFVSSVFTNDIKKNFNVGNCTIVSPDVGGIDRARAIAKRLDVGLAIIDKRRQKPGQVLKRPCLLQLHRLLQQQRLRNSHLRRRVWCLQGLQNQQLAWPSTHILQ